MTAPSKADEKKHKSMVPARSKENSIKKKNQGEQIGSGEVIKPPEYAKGGKRSGGKNERRIRISKT